MAFPLLVAAADWCVVEREPTYGFLIMEIGLSKGHAGAQGGRGVSVVYVHPQSPAAPAGLMPGDELIRVNARPVDEIRADEVSQLIRRMTVARIQPLRLDAVRSGHHLILNLWAVPTCQFSVELIESDWINGIADGRHVGVTTGTMRSVGSDDELAWMVAHEIAHNVLNHSQNTRSRAMLNAFVGATMGTSAEAPTEVP